MRGSALSTPLAQALAILIAAGHRVRVVQDAETDLWLIDDGPTLTTAQVIVAAERKRLEKSSPTRPGV